MLIVMNHNATQADVDAITEIVKEMGFRAEPIPGSERTAIGVLGNHGYVDDSKILELPGVQRVIHVSKPYKLVSRDFHPDDTIVDVAGVKVGQGCRPVVVGGPCAVESLEQIVKTALFVKKCGGDMLRGGAFKPRTGPHTFQGLREEGLKMLAIAGKESGLPIYFAPSVIHLPTVPPQRKVNRIDMGTADKLCAVALGIRDQSMRPGIDYEATSTRKFFAPAPWPTLRATRRRTQRNRWPAPAPMPVAVLLDAAIAVVWLAE